MKKLFFWSDKWGSDLRIALIDYAWKKNFIYEDLWEVLDYPDIAKDVCKKVIEEDWVWVLLCGTGIWMSIAANKVYWIRAANVHNSFEAEKSRQHNDANVICMWWRVLWTELAINCFEHFLNSEFEWWRHEARVAKFEN